MPRTPLSSVLCLVLAASAVALPAGAQTPRGGAPGPAGPAPDLTGLLTPLVPPASGPSTPALDPALLTPLVSQDTGSGPALKDADIPPLVRRPDASDASTPALPDDLLTPLDGSHVDMTDFLDPLTPRAGAETPALPDDLLTPLDSSHVDMEDFLDPLTPRPTAETPALPEDLFIPLDGSSPDLSDFLDPLVRTDETDPRPRQPTPRDTDYLDFIRAQEAQQQHRNQGRESVLVRRIRADPCGDFEVSWGGRKTCHAREHAYWELVYKDDGPPPPPPEENEEREDSDWGLDMGGPGPSGGLGGGTRGPSGALGGGAAPGGAPGGAPGAPGAPGSGGGAPGSAPGGGVAGPTPGRIVGSFTPRLESATRTRQGLLDVRVSLTANPGGPALLTDEWLVVSTTADGVERSTTAILQPTAGAGRPFDDWRHVMQGDVVQVRFLVPAAPDGAPAATVAIRQTGASPVVFDISDGLW